MLASRMSSETCLSTLVSELLAKCPVDQLLCGANYSLYDGLAGQALAIALGYSCTRQPTLKKAPIDLIAKASDLVLRDKQPHGMFTGLAGVAFAAWRIENILGEQCLDKTVIHRLADSSTELPSGDSLDLISGAAGKCVVLACLVNEYPILRDRLIEEKEKLTSAAVASISGVSWPIFWPGIRQNLLGLSHGGGGVSVGLMFADIGLGNRNSEWFVRSSTSFELTRQQNDWPDYRYADTQLSSLSSDDNGRIQGPVAALASKYVTGQLELSSPRLDWAWCSGSSGTAHCRLFEMEYRGRQRALEVACVEAVRHSTGYLSQLNECSPSICHGVASILECVRHAEFTSRDCIGGRSIDVCEIGRALLRSINSKLDSRIQNWRFMTDMLGLIAVLSAVESGFEGGVALPWLREVSESRPHASGCEVFDLMNSILPKLTSECRSFDVPMPSLLTDISSIPSGNPVEKLLDRVSSWIDTISGDYATNLRNQFNIDVARLRCADREHNAALMLLLQVTSASKLRSLSLRIDDRVELFEGQEEACSIIMVNTGRGVREFEVPSKCFLSVKNWRNRNQINVTNDCSELVSQLARLGVISQSPM